MKTVHSIEQFRQVYLPEYNERRRERRERLGGAWSEELDKRLELEELLRRGDRKRGKG